MPQAMTRLALVLISWLGCAVVVSAAYHLLPVPVRADQVIVIHAMFEDALAKQEPW